MNDRIMLYVEDEEDDLFLMKRAFNKTRREGCTLITVSDGKTAVDYLSGAGPYADRFLHPFPAVVLLDLNLPIKSGLEVLGCIRGSAQFSQLPVVIFSSSNQLSDQRKAYALGANSYLIKPSVSVELERVALALQEYWLLLNWSTDTTHGDEIRSSSIVARTIN